MRSINFFCLHFGTLRSWQRDPRPWSAMAATNTTAIKVCQCPSTHLPKHHPKKNNKNTGPTSLVPAELDHYPQSLHNKHIMIFHAGIAGMLVLTKSSLFRVDRFTRANEMPAFRAVRVWEKKREREMMKSDKSTDPLSLSAVLCSIKMDLHTSMQ